MQQPGRSPSESLELRRQYQRYSSAGCYVDVRSLTHERFVNSPMLFLPYPPKRDSLLCVARHKAVTRTWDAPLFKALRPGFFVSGVEPSGVCFSWYCQPSSRSLGHSLLLGQRSRLNFLSDLVRFFFHQHHRRPHTEFVSHRHNSDPRTEMSWMFFGHAAKEFSQFAVLADRRPRSLDK